MFTSAWGNQNQNQQQQQQPQQQQSQPSAFGQPNAFGANTGTGGFGSTAFGQQQPQQPQVNPMFGNLQTPAPAGQSGGFGAFTNPSTTSAFGQPKPTTGFGAFSGGTGAFNSTPSAFGQTTNTGTGIFGQPSTSTTGAAFGSTSAFGASKPATSVFGSTTTAPTVNNGTAGTPYTPFNEKDAGSNVMLQYQAITCTPAYRGFSLEELRLQDYAQNRKTASTSAFGTGPTFGTTQPTTTATTTGTGIFGSQTNQPAQNSIFSGGQANTTGTGGFGTFGQTNQPSTTQPAAGIFGGGTAFGQQQQPQPQQPQQQPQQQQQASPFGTFGQQSQPQQQTGGIFGGSAFGSTANKPAFGTTGAFGNQPSTSAFGTQTTFGQTAQPQQQTGLFGNTQPTQNPLGTFGTANTQNKPLFGTTTTNQPATAGAFGMFGGQNQPNQQGQQQPAQQPSIFGTTGGTGVFGTATNQQHQQNPAQPATSLFGTQTNTGGTGLFGNSGGGIFGNTGAQQQQQQPSGVQQPLQTNTFGNLFGPKPAGTPSLFPSVTTTATQPQTGLFGSTQQSSLFGPKPPAPQLGISTSGQPGGLFGSGMGTSTNVLGASTAVQPSLTASIAEPIDTSVNIFSMLPPGPRSLDLDQSQQKKKQGFFVDVPTRSPLPRQMGYTPASSKLRGFGSSTVGSVNGLISTNSLSFTSGKPNALSLNGSTGSDGILARSSSPALGSGSRQSVKKVILDKKVEPAELFVKSGSPNSTRGGKITFSPALSVAAREKDATRPHSPAAGQLESPVPASKNPPRSLSRFTANTAEPSHTSATEATADTTLQEGDYYIRPPLATLKKASYDELSSFVGLVVGRVGYGEIHFLEPVDLTGLSKLGALLGDVVRFDDKECSVYPDSEDVDKPPPGSGLNVKARLILERCWATDKATREPIKDASHPSAVKHLKRLKNMKDTRFEGFEMDSGKWTFTVDHF